ncbi:MAG: PEP-CTERM/exosortase system-associated acyltransferase [Nitrosomonadales bacterium]|nr:MAG: PEP-CTERM/exosortase system-associated acyltransferase [Nitrosomonadales bacterium]
MVKSEAPMSHFDFCIIDGTQYLQDSYALRYEVYCNEQHFLAPEDFPSRLETDSYDNNSIHVGAINREGGLVGTLRLVLPSARGFPFYEHCQFFGEYKHLSSLANPALLSAAEISRLAVSKSYLLTAAEISRLAVSKSYRRRTNDGLYDLSSQEDIEIPTGSENEMTLAHRRRRPEIILGLYKTMYQASKRQGITHWFAAMEKTLLRLLYRYQFGFIPIGPEVDYYGPVTPYLAEIAHIEAGIRQRCPEMYAEFIQGLEPELVPEAANR